MNESLVFEVLTYLGPTGVVALLLLYFSKEWYFNPWLELKHKEIDSALPQNEEVVNWLKQSIENNEGQKQANRDIITTQGKICDSLDRLDQTLEKFIDFGRQFVTEVFRKSA